MEISNFEKTKIGGEYEARGNFKMKASAKAFRILSDGLYQNKIAAVIRELSTNAHDSHVAAGTPQKPFLVHLPSAVEPYFSVRDYGVGMAPEVLEELYVTYFDSTKTTSNDFTGCLGLGSKSPFSYSDNFSVTSFWEGRKRVYLARLDSEGMPCIDLIQDEKSDEPTGIEVRVNCKPADIYNWNVNALNIFPYFEVTPEFNAVTNDVLNIRRNKELFQGEKIGEKDSIQVFVVSGTNVNLSKIVMGNVAYPMPSANQFFDENADSIQKEILNVATFLIKVPIGFLDIAASRESLSIDVNTKRNLQKIVRLIRDIFVEDIQKSIKKVDTVYQGILLLDEIQKKYPKIDLSNSKTYNLNFLVDGKDVQKIYHGPRKLWDKLQRETISPKVLTFTASHISLSDIETKEAFFEIAEKRNFSHLKYTKNIPWNVMQSRIGSVKSNDGNNFKTFVKTIGIIIDGEKELVYERVIKEYLQDCLVDYMCESVGEIEKGFKEPMQSCQFSIQAFVLKAYENETRIEQTSTQKFLDSFNLSIEDDIHFVSDFKDNYKIQREKKVPGQTSTQRKSKKEDREFSLQTYSLVRCGSGHSLNDYYKSETISEEMIDETINYINRDGLNWKIPEIGLHSGASSYRYMRPSSANLFNFLEHVCGKKNMKIYALTDTQIERLQKRKFDLNDIGPDLKDQIEKVISELEAENPQVFFDLVSDSSSLINWRRALTLSKNDKNEEFVDFILSTYLQSKNNTTLFDSKKLEKANFVKNLVEDLSKFDMKKFWKKVEEEKSKCSKALMSGDDLVENMVNEIPPFRSWIYNIYYAGRDREFAKLLNFLQMMEVHKKL